MQDTHPTFRLSAKAQVSVVTLQGDFGSVVLAANPGFGAQVARQIQPFRRPKVAVDLTDISFGGAALLSLLVEIRADLTWRGGAIAMAAAPEWFQSLLCASRLDSRWIVHPSLDAAVRSLIA